MIEHREGMVPRCLPGSMSCLGRERTGGFSVKSRRRQPYITCLAWRRLVVDPR